MSARMRGKRIGVEKLGKSTNQAGLFALPEDASAVGTIRYLGDGLAESDLKIGMKVYFGKNRHELRMEGKDILVMDEDNVYATAE